MTIEPTELLLIDDSAGLLGELEEAVRRLVGSNTDVHTWSPTQSERPRERLDELVSEETVLVVTDDDLTGNGLTGLFGATVVDWCQRKSVPVALFSRRIEEPERPDVFEIVVSAATPEIAAAEICRTFRGFQDVHTQLAGTNWQNLSGPAEAAAIALGRPSLETELALYTSKLFSANRPIGPRTPDPHGPDDQLRFLVYVVGHVLRNVVLPYPGPIMDERVLAAYFCTTVDEADVLDELFAPARYDGPFATDRMYWRETVDEILMTIGSDAPDDFDNYPQHYRARVEAHIHRQLANHACTRCFGTRGGFFCPFTERAVCRRDDCSVEQNSWIPQAADLLRTERDHFDEWQPFLGF